MSSSLFLMFLTSLTNLEEAFNIPDYNSSTKEPTPSNLSLSICVKGVLQPPWRPVNLLWSMVEVIFSWPDCYIL